MRQILNRGGGKGIRLIGCDVSVRDAKVIQNVHHTKLNISKQNRNIQGGYTPNFPWLQFFAPAFSFFFIVRKI